MPNLPWQHNTIVQLSLVGEALANQIVNVFHFQLSEVRESGMVNDEEAITESGEIADHWISNMKSAWLAVHADEYILRMVTAQVVERPGNFRHRLSPVERPQTTANVGTNAGAVGSLAASAVLRWRTPQAGKSHRGRTYVGPLTTPWQTDGKLATVAVTALQNFQTTWLNMYRQGGTTTVEWVHTIYSRPYNTGEYEYASRKTGRLAVVSPPDYAGNATNVTTGSVDPVLRVQRRRELGVGG
jgi:hypothetical protein